MDTETIHSKLGRKLHQFLQREDHPNILLYGPRYSGKTFLIKYILSEVYTTPLQIINNKDFTFETCGCFYYFNCRIISDKKKLIQYIQDITKTYNHYLNSINRIIFDHFECLNEHIQETLKVIIEKSSVTSRSIIITNNYSNVNDAIQSRCIFLRIPLPNKYEKYIYIVRHLNEYPINHFLLEKDCGNQLLSIDHIINKHKHQFHCDTAIDLYTTKIMNTLFEEDLQLSLIQEIAYDMKQINIVPEILFSLIEGLTRILDTQILIKIIQETAKYEHLIQKSYRDIIYLESYIIKVYNIIHYETKSL